MAERHISSIGLALADTDWLDAHFEACRADYERIVGSVGIAPGWHLLDAGCGSGGFLPLLAELVGPGGRLTAVDLAPDSIRFVRQRLAAASLPCPCEAHVGSVLALPFPDDTFDGIWCANVLMYLSPAALTAALAEFRRVLRPGGWLIAKEFDLRLATFFPCDPALFWRVWEAQNRDDSPQQGALRSRGLHAAFAHGGFEAVTQRTVIVEINQPLADAARRFIADNLAWHAQCAATLGMPAADLAAWHALTDPTSPRYLLDQPDCSYCEPHVVARGRVPHNKA